MRRGDRIRLLLLMALFGAPAMAAWLVHNVWPPSATGNYGELLSPKVPALPGLTDAAGQPARLDGLRGRWVLLTIAGGDCAAECRWLVRLTRQVRLAQGRERGRVVRALLLGGSDAAPVERGLSVYTVPGASLERLHPGPDPAIYVLDPLGRAMLRFPRQPDGSGMISDLRRLLLASPSG